MTRPEAPIRIAGALLAVGGGACFLYGQMLGFNPFGGTDASIYARAAGGPLRMLAWIAIPLGITAVFVRGRRGVACVVAGTVLLATLVVPTWLDLHPEAGERSVLAAFVPPPGSVRLIDSDYQFPTLTARWEMSGAREDVCATKERMMEALSDAPAIDDDVNTCSITSITGTRDDHDVFLSFGPDFEQPSKTAIILTVTRRV